MALSDERRGIGARNEAIRRAGGQRVEAERRGDQGLTAALNRLIEPERQARSLRKIDPRGALDAARGRADYNPAGKQIGGVSWPLAETDKSKRTVADEEIVSTDGLVVVVFKRVTSFEMQDGGENIGRMEFKA
ncbi:TPA: hypothetical protein SMV93_000275 [Pseudomonas aeruginosa]|nr:hypothetical protein [Pseudomonas aeruginosa]